MKLSDMMTEFYDGADRGDTFESKSSPEAPQPSAPADFSRLAKGASLGFNTVGKGMVNTGSPTVNSGMIGGISAGLNSMAAGNPTETVVEDAALGMGKGLLGQVGYSALSPSLGMFAGPAVSGAMSVAQAVQSGTPIGKALQQAVVNSLSTTTGFALGGPIGAAIGSFAGPMLNNSINNGLIGDVFDARSNEIDRDHFEDMGFSMEEAGRMSSMGGGLNSNRGAMETRGQLAGYNETFSGPSRSSLADQMSDFAGETESFGGGGFNDSSEDRGGDVGGGFNDDSEDRGGDGGW